MEKEEKENAVIWYIAARPCLKESLELLYKNFNNKYGYPVIVFSFGHIYSRRFKKRVHKQIDPAIKFIELPKPQIPPNIKEEELFYNRTEIPYVRDNFPKSRIGYLHMANFKAGQAVKHPALKGYDYALRIDDDSFIVKPIDFDIFKFVRERNIKYASFGYKVQDTERVRQTQIGFREFLASYIKQHQITPRSTKIHSDHDWKGTGVTSPILYDLSVFRSSDWQRWWNRVNETGGIYKYRWGDQEIEEAFIHMFYSDKAQYNFGFYEKGICHHGGRGIVHQENKFMEIMRTAVRRLRPILKRLLKIHKFPAKIGKYLLKSKTQAFLYGKFYKNPLNVQKIPPKEKYVKLAEEAKNQDIRGYLDALKERFEFLPDKDFIDELALSTQITIKKSTLNYAHGYLLYAALSKYLNDNPNLKNPTILEIGTARGFSAVMMAKALEDMGASGKIITVDVLPNETPIYWNCIHDAEGKKTRLQLLEQWKGLVEKYIVFLQGYSDLVLKQLSMPRVHFAFIDGLHTYEGAKNDADFVAVRQKKGDVIVFDDYTPTQFPGIVKLVDEIRDSGKYTVKTFSSGPKRGYAYCVRN